MSKLISFNISLWLLFGYLNAQSQTRTIINSPYKINKDSLLQLSIQRTRPMTRIEIGLGITHINLSGLEWQKNIVNGNKDTIPFNSQSNPFSFSMGCGFPFKKLNKALALGTNISLLTAVGRNTSMSIPLFLTFKIGGDATTYENHKKIGAGLGLGVQSGFYYFSGSGHNMFGTSYIRPAYFAEFNFTPHLGLIKLRCIGNLGPLIGSKTYKDEYSVDFHGTYKLQATTSFLLVITPFWAVQKYMTKAFSKIP